MADISITTKCYLRKAELEDVGILFDWVNDPAVRRSAFDSHIITYDEHVKWFDHIMNDQNQIQYILMNGNVPIGQIRLSIDDECAEIDYSISNDARGFGYGQAIIRLVIEQVRREYPSIKKLIGRIKPSNVASYYCFTRSGFEEKYQQLEFDIQENHKTLSNVSEKYDKHASSVGVCGFPGGGLRILFLTNNRNTLELFDWINNRCLAEIISNRVLKEFLLTIKPDLVISYNYNYMISKECIDAVSGNIINMHISLLPWNRGFSPNIWSFIDDTPKGVTIHMLSQGLDEGDVILQHEYHFDPQKETFQTTYNTLNEGIVELLKSNWEIIENGAYKEYCKKQSVGGSYHTIADLKNLMEIVPFEWSDNIADYLNRYKRSIT